MFAEAVLLGLLVGALRGGRITNLAFSNIRGWMLIIVGFLLQMVPALFGRSGLMDRWGHVIAFLMVLLIVPVVFLNLEKKGFWAVGVGTVLNLIPMLTHGLRMPILLRSLQVTGRQEMLTSMKSGAVLNYVGLEHLHGWTSYLGKVIPLPKFYPLAQVLSVGDLFISLGLFLFIYWEMTSRSSFKSRSQMVSMPYRSY